MNGCSSRTGECPNTRRTQSSWVVCHGNHQHRCTDYWGGGRRCICRGTYERACGDHPCAVAGTSEYGLNYLGTEAAPAPAGAAQLPQADLVTFDVSGSAFVGTEVFCGGGDLIWPEVTDLIVTAELIEQDFDNSTEPIIDETEYNTWILICQSLNDPACVCRPCL